MVVNFYYGKADGAMESATYFDEDGTSVSAVVYCEDLATSTVISENPLLEDPYEEKYVYVDNSTIGEHAGQGLFAKKDLPENFVCSLYNGIRLSHAIVDGRDWKENNNTISVDENTVIDVPKEYNLTSVYKATLGHKANHSFTPNSKYDTFFDHPRFGKIKCIRTISKISKGSEIFVDYGYTDEFPEWYQKLNKATTE